MDNWDGKNLDWPKPGAFGQLSLSVAQKWDGIVAAAEQSGICFQMTLQHHGQYSSSVDPQWSGNPYNTANGGFLSNATQFFTNATAKALTKRKLRYAVARWGYSPAVMAWELFNEVQFTDAAQVGQWSIIGAWHDEMAQFIRSQASTRLRYQLRRFFAQWRFSPPSHPQPVPSPTQSSRRSSAPIHHR